MHNEKNLQLKRLTGCLPDLPDQRDMREKHGLRSMFGFLPKEFTSVGDLIRAKNKVLDQGEEGSCVVNAFALGAAYQLFRETGFWIEISRRWAMTIAQKYDPWPETSPTGEDGTSVRGCLKGLNHEGMMLESTVPYVAGKRKIDWNSAMRSQGAKEAAILRLSEYRSCMFRDKPHVRLIQQGIMRYGSVIVGVNLPESFFDLTERSCIVIAGKEHEGMHAQHSMAIVGWVTKQGQIMFELANSWGVLWGRKGFCLWPVESFMKACYTAWVFDVLKQGELL